MHHQLTPISGIFLSTVLGILLDRYFCLTPFIYLAGCVVAGGLGLWGIADGRRDKQRKDRQIRCSFLSVVPLRFGIIWIGGMNLLIRFVPDFCILFQ